MSKKQAFTIIEIMVVMVIIGVVAVIAFPNFNTPMEQGKAANAQNALLAIYSAEQNYKNNDPNSSYCYPTVPSPTNCDTLADINTDFTLNIPDDGTYTYACANPAAGTFTCTATRTTGAPVITVTLNLPIQLAGEVNPACTPAGNSACP